MPDLSVSIQTTGLDEALAGLKKLDDDCQRKIFPQATKAGAKIILPVAQGNAAFKTGFLGSQIKIRSANKPSAGIFRSTIGVSDKDWTGPAFYAAFAMLGHKQVGHKPGKKVGRDIKADPFLIRSVAQAGDRAAQAMIDAIAKGVENARV